MLVLVVPVAPDAVYPVMLLNEVILAEDAFVPPLATGTTPVLVKSLLASVKTGLLAVNPVFVKPETLIDRPDVRLLTSTFTVVPD
jgi:hypothetical protein